MVRIYNDNQVIMVDDNDGDVEIARTCYEESKLRNPWMAFSNGPDFLAHLVEVKHGKASMPALVLLDINMPGVSGIEVLERTRKDEFFKELPIFCMLTSSSDPRDMAEAERVGASGFVTKPDDVAEYVSFFDSLA